MESSYSASIQNMTVTTESGEPVTSETHYQLVAAAINYLRERAREQPTLGELAGNLGVSEAHLQPAADLGHDEPAELER